MVNKQQMEKQLILHEGCVLHFYPDSEGFTTVGVGWNVSARGVNELQRLLGRKVNETGDITRAEALMLLRLDIARFEQATLVAFPPYKDLSEIRQRVVLDMAFNMGFKALGFKATIAAALAKDWSRCAREMYKSKWARQVGDGPGGKRDRVDRLSQMVLTDQECPELRAA